MSPSNLSEEKDQPQRPSASKSEPITDTKATQRRTAKETKTKSTESTKANDSESEYAYNILKNQILEPSPDRSSKMDLESLTEDELRLFKVVQHLINEGFIDEIELLRLVKSCFIALKFPKYSNCSYLGRA